MSLRFRYLMKQYFVVLLVFICCACGNRQENELAMLQRAYVFSGSENERSQIIDRLEEYITNRSVADSIAHKIEHDVDSIIIFSDTEKKQDISNYQDVKNIYTLESDFYSLLKSKIYSCAKQEDVIFNGLDSIAEYLDSNLNIQYWIPFLNLVKKYSPETAKNWITADLASQKSKQNMNNLNQIKIGLQYTTLGLQNLQQCMDMRIKLDIIHQVQYALYKYYGFYDLSIALATCYLGKCHSIGYELRANGLLFDIATAFYESGKLSTALRMFRKVVLMAEQNDSIPSMIWYLKNGLINIANTYYWSGEYAKAWAVCDSVERSQLTNREKLVILMNRGLINRDLGNYDDAEAYFTKALKLAESTNDFENKIKMLNNFGFLFLQLSEYHKALEFFECALKDLETCSPDSRELKITLLINIADVYARIGDYELVEQYLKTSRFELEYLGEYPKREVDLLNSLGKSRMNIGQYSEAAESFIKAELISGNNVLINMGLDVKLNLANCYISMLNKNKAEDKIAEVLSIAVKIDDIERMIDAYAALARLEAVKGNMNKAVRISNRMIKIIDVLTQKFKNTQRLIAYQQKINNYLKKAIVYEIKLNRLDSAFIKLNYANSLAYIKNINRDNNSFDNLRNLDLKNFIKHVKGNTQIIQFMITEDTLYTFIIYNHEIAIHRKPAEYDSLKAKVVKYVNTINQTIHLFKNYDQQNVDAHYKLTTLLSKQLFDILIDDEIKNRFIDPNNTLYIIPDDFLHFLPFATLATEKKNEIQFLIEKTNIAYLPGFFSIKSNGNKDRKSKLKKVLLAADPEMINIKDFTSFISHLYPKTQLLGSETEVISKQEILSEMGNKFDMYIFAGHSYADAVNVTNSYINVTSTSATNNNNKTFKLTIADINALDWDNSNLIFLLGCETAGGSLYQGMGIFGLQSNFLLSGADNVIASLWRIDATQSIQQTTDFLAAYHQTNNAISSIRYVQLQAINNLKSNKYFRHPHPYFWGSYLLSQKQCFKYQ